MIVALMIAVIGHEIMHGYVALKYGDTTAKSHGRLTINPIPHIDIIGTIIMPLMLIIVGAPFLFGWAKPVPVNERTVLKNGGYLGAIYVSLAGVAYNFALALLAVAILKNSEFTGVDGYVLFSLLKSMLIINIVLAVFNLWPIPPLDGSKAVLYFCMNFGIKTIVNLYYKIEKYGMIILLIILMTPLKGIFFAPVGEILNFLLKN
jgi:Zn-dependent protease